MKMTSRLMLGMGLILSAILVSSVAARIFWTSAARTEKSHGRETASRTQESSDPVGLEAVQSRRLEEGLREEMPAFDPIKRLGWRIWGKVTKPLRQPLAGAKVVLRLFDGRVFQDTIDPVYTDEKGRYTASIPAAQTIRMYPPHAILPMEIHGDATAAGHRPNYNFLLDLPHPDQAETPLRLDFVLKEGGRLVGCLKTVDARPVGNAKVFVLYPEKTWMEAAQTGPDGAYALPIEAACRIHLCALKFDSGMATPVSLDVDPTRDGNAPDLVLREYGSIQGTVEFPDGQPLDRVVINAYPETLLDQPSQALDLFGAFSCFMNRSYLPLDGDNFSGLPFASVETDSRGRFRMQGLKPGPYFLWVQELKALDDPGSVLPAEELRLHCATGTTDVRMVVDLYRIRVILRDRMGYRIPLAELTYESNEITGWERVVSGLIDLQIAPGPLRLTATTKDGLYADGEVLVEEGEHAPVKELVLDDRPPEGRILLKIRGSGGALLDPVPPLTVLLTGRVDGIQVDLADLKRDSGAFAIPVPPDSYDLVLYPEVDVETLADVTYMPTSLAGIVATSGETTPVTVELKQGGRLNLKLASPGIFENEGAYQIRAIHLEKNRSEPLYYFLPDGKPPAVSCTRLKPGISYLNTKLFEPGEYRLEIRSDVHAPTSVDFRILPGEVAGIELRLERQ